jgi:two-component system, response regulator PdtaR
MSAAINILIVEDEAVLAMDLSDLLEEEGYTVISTANNGLRALRLHQQHRLDLALCDISIKGDWDGIQTVEQLMAHRPIPIIFLTALTDKATLERAMTIRPAAYLIKPVTVPGLRAAVELALRNFAPPAVVPPPAVVLPPAGSSGPEPMLRIDDAVFIKHKYQFVKVQLDAIDYLEADSAYTTLVTATHRYALRLTIGHVLTRLNFPRLVRIHRSYAVNLGRVSTFNEREVCLPGLNLPLGRLYKPDFLRQFDVR